MAKVWPGQEQVVGSVAVPSVAKSCYSILTIGRICMSLGRQMNESNKNIWLEMSSPERKDLLENATFDWPEKTTVMTYIVVWQI